MSDAQIIRKWQDCEKMAKELGISLRVGIGVILLSGDKLEETRNTDSLDELLGFLHGFLEGSKASKPK